MKYELDVDAYNGVGPYRNLYDHGAGMVIQQYDEDGELDETVFVCLDCGYTAHDSRLFMHAECDPEQNQINVSWRDKLGGALDESD